MKTLKYIIILSALLCSAFLNAQTFHLKMEIVAETSTDFTIDIFASGDPGFELGSSNLVFDFDPLVVSNPTLVSHNLTEMTGPFTVYSDVNVTEPASGKASLNIVLDATGVGDLMDTYPAYTNIAQIHFDVLDASATKSLNWLYTGGSTETVVCCRALI